MKLQEPIADVEVNPTERKQDKEDENNEEISVKEELDSDLRTNISYYTGVVGSIAEFSPQIEIFKNLKEELEKLKDSDAVFEERLNSIQERTNQTVEKIEENNIYKKIEMDSKFNQWINYYSREVGEVEQGKEYIKKMKDLQGELTALKESSTDFNDKLDAIVDKYHELWNGLDSIEQENYLKIEEIKRYAENFNTLYEKLREEKQSVSLSNYIKSVEAGFSKLATNAKNKEEVGRILENYKLTLKGEKLFEGKELIRDVVIGLLKEESEKYPKRRPRKLRKIKR
ncbi:MAG: hypothetical protein EXS48_02565 [Candidatus Staskawiczbacteria bacterium]|nr:hypothetical protein [Candidatus Staskawiczbacteria bacterium]